VIAHLRGTLVEKGIDHVVVDVGGVGLRLTVSLQTLAELPSVSQPVSLVTHLQVREDALTLYGFAGERERTAFEQCISVQMVGPKLAMSILSTLTPDELGRAVAAQDHARLTRIPGVGKKTAERLVLELRDKLERVAPASAGAGARPATGLAAQVASALVNLGYRAQEAERAASDAAAGADGASVAELLKKALRLLAE
jgi:Holliday junction DNA helicase RuvA